MTSGEMLERLTSILTVSENAIGYLKGYPGNPDVEAYARACIQMIGKIADGVGRTDVRSAKEMD